MSEDISLDDLTVRRQRDILAEALERVLIQSGVLNANNGYGPQGLIAAANDYAGGTPLEWPNPWTRTQFHVEPFSGERST